MKLLKFYFIASLIILWFSNPAKSQDISTDGDLTVGGGHISFVNDITMPSPKVITIQNQDGDFSIRTFGTPGSEFRVDRDQGFLFKNVDSNEAFEFEVTDQGNLLIRNEAQGDTIMFIHDNERWVGINGFPRTELNVVQIRTPQLGGPNNQVTDLRGMTVEDHDGSRCTLFIDSANDLDFAFNGFYRSFINDQTGAYTALSDRRLKQNIKTLDPVLAKVLKLRPTTYQFKGEGERETTLGFIAQEVQNIMPEMVNKKEGIYALTYDNFAVLSIKAIQEQQELINQLIERIEKLENK